MKKLLHFIFFISFLASGQNNPDAKRDYTWVFGSNFYTPFDNEFTIDFLSGAISFHPFQHNLKFCNNNTSISDTAGNLLFFTNGQQIADRNGNLMENGDSLSYTDYYQYQNQYNLGPNYPQSTLILPHPYYSNIFYVFNLRLVWPGGIICAGPICTGLLRSTIDMNENNGLGKVINLNQTIIDDTLALGGLNAVRHANGRDWWVVIPGLNKLKFHKILLTSEGVILSDQTLGNISKNSYERTCFSPDGSMYARYYGCYDSAYYGIYQVHIFSFDRSNGNLIPKSFFTVPFLFGTYGLSFSPSSRLLYINDECFCFQYDLLSSNIPQSKLLIAEYDGFHSQSNPSAFSFHKLGPDNKIYVGAANAEYIHVIEQPDILGDSCHFVQRAHILPTSNMNGALPNIPNFRLGAITGIGDDPLLEKLTIIKAIPNPASISIRFELDISNNTKPMEFQIADITGQIIESQYVGPFQGIVNADVSKYANGIYFGLLRNEKTVVARVKFVVER